MFSCQQGELAHKIVKRLYRSTNKCNSEHQIAKRYRRLECTCWAHRKRLHSHTKLKTTNEDSDNKQTVTINQEDNQPDGDSELRYYISPSKNLKTTLRIFLAPFIITKVTLLTMYILLITLCDYTNYFQRIFYLSFKIIYSDD